MVAEGILSAGPQSEKRLPRRTTVHPSVMLGERSEQITVFMIGCSSKVIEHMRRTLDLERFRLVDKELRTLFTGPEAANREKDIFLMGPCLCDNEQDEFIMNAQDAKARPMNIRCVISDETSYERRMNLNASQILVPYKESDFLGFGQIEMNAYFEDDSGIADTIVEGIEQASENRGFVGNSEGGRLICRFSEGVDRVIDPKQIEEIARAMNKFAFFFDLHQLETNHASAILHVMTSAVRGYGHRRVLDVGCGSGFVIEELTRHVISPEFLAPNGARQQTRIVGVDMDPIMLVRANRRLKMLTDQLQEMLKHMDLGGDIDVGSMLDLGLIKSDFLHFNAPETMDTLTNGRKFDMILAVYLFNWIADREMAVRIMTRILEPGGTILVIDEKPMLVTPSSYMDEETAAGIRAKIRPLDFGVRDEIMGDYGMIRDREFITAIDEFHKCHAVTYVNARR